MPIATTNPSALAILHGVDPAPDGMTAAFRVALEVIRNAAGTAMTPVYETTQTCPRCQVVEQGRSIELTTLVPLVVGATAAWWGVKLLLRSYLRPAAQVPARIGARRNAFNDERRAVVQAVAPEELRRERVLSLIQHPAGLTGDQLGYVFNYASDQGYRHASEGLPVDMRLVESALNEPAREYYKSGYRTGHEAGDAWRAVELDVVGDFQQG